MTTDWRPYNGRVDFHLKTFGNKHISLDVQLYQWDQVTDPKVVEEFTLSRTNPDYTSNYRSWESGNRIGFFYKILCKDCDRSTEFEGTVVVIP